MKKIHRLPVWLREWMKNPPYAGLAQGNGFGSQHKLRRLLLLIKGVTNMI
jgi:hypothetical protein